MNLTRKKIIEIMEEEVNYPGDDFYSRGESDRSIPEDRFDDIADKILAAAVEPVTPININQKVRIKLTEAGFRILRESHEQFVSDITKRTGVDPVAPVLPPPVDMDGYSTFQLWEVMQVFGPHMWMGCEQPFETEILIELES